jgi:signal peptidase I
MSTKTAIRAASAAVFVALAGAAWLFLAPAQLGGGSRYAIIEGSSMHPVVSGGDLAVIRGPGAYHVGQVVLYRDPVLDVDVLHRIVRVEGGGFVLKGDANGFLDDARPSPSELEGELWFSVPYLGSALIWARVPMHAAVVVFVLTVFALGGIVERPRRRTALSRAR